MKGTNESSILYRRWKRKHRNTRNILILFEAALILDLRDYITTPAAFSQLMRSGKNMLMTRNACEFENYILMS